MSPQPYLVTAAEAKTPLHVVVHDPSIIKSDSGVAIRYKLMGLEQLTRGKERWFREGLKERLSCYAHFLSVKGERALDESQVQIPFIYLNIYLAASGLSCSIWDLVP